MKLKEKKNNIETTLSIKLILTFQEELTTIESKILSKLHLTCKIKEENPDLLWLYHNQEAKSILSENLL